MPTSSASAVRSRAASSPPPRVHLGGIPHPDLRSALQDAVIRRMGDEARVMIRGQGPGDWLEPGENGAAPLLVLSGLAALDDQLPPEAMPRLRRRVQAGRLWVGALFLEPADLKRAHRSEGLLRALDGRLTLLPDPETLAHDPARLDRWLGHLLHLLDPHALLEARPLETEAGPRLLLRFGDDWTVTASLHVLGLAVELDGLELASALPGEGGRTLEVLRRTGDGTDPGVLVLEAAVLRQRLEEAGFGPGAANGVGLTTGVRVRGARESRGWSQAELGRQSGLHQAVISNLEREIHSPRLDTLHRVAEGLGLTLPELLSYVPVP
jgi:DNA-binding XRE family transcriptional regulator